MESRKSSHEGSSLVVGQNVSTDMFGQVIGAHESTATNWTGEFFLARVSSLVSAEFIASTELSATSFPGADKWLFTWKRGDKCYNCID